MVTAGSRKSSKTSKVVKVPINEEHFRTDEDKKSRWSYFAENAGHVLNSLVCMSALETRTSFCINLGAEIKKELASLTGILVDIPQDDPLKADLEKAQAKLNKLALQFPVSESSNNLSDHADIWCVQGVPLHSNDYTYWVPTRILGMFYTHY